MPRRVPVITRESTTQDVQHLTDCGLPFTRRPALAHLRQLQYLTHVSGQGGAETAHCKCFPLISCGCKLLRTVY